MLSIIYLIAYLRGLYKYKRMGILTDIYSRRHLMAYAIVYFFDLIIFFIIWNLYQNIS